MRHTRSFLDTYGLPHRPPVVFRIVALLVLVPGIGFLIWWFAPHSAGVVGALVAYLLIAGFLGLWRISTARELNRPPGRHPQPPPSTTPPSTS
jgi:hypothetical protein